MNFNRRRLFGLFGAAVGAPVAIKAAALLPAPVVAANGFGLSPAMSALPDLREWQEDYISEISRFHAADGMSFVQNGLAAHFRGIPVVVKEPS